MRSNSLRGNPAIRTSTSTHTSLDAIIQRFEAASVSGTLYDDLSEQKPIDEDLIDALKRSFSVRSSKESPKKELTTPKSIRKCHSLAYLKDSERAAMDAKTRKMQDAGLRSLSTARAKECREVTFRMVFNNITPCPDPVWIDSISNITGCSDKSIIHTWFETHLAEQNQCNSRAVSCLHSVQCDNRTVFLRPVAHRQVASWSDALFEELVRIHGHKKRGLMHKEWLQAARF